MNPNAMPQKSAPVRTITRTGDSQPVCDYVRDNGAICTCEGVTHGFVESVRVITRVRRNPAMADALRKAGWAK